MAPAPNKEQLFFLAAGGVILAVIMAVVVFNMMRDPTRMVEEELTPKRPTVALNATEQEAKTRAEEEDRGRKQRPAPVFRPVDGNPTRTDVEEWKAPDPGTAPAVSENHADSPPPKPVPPPKEPPGKEAAVAAVAPKTVPAAAKEPPAGKGMDNKAKPAPPAAPAKSAPPPVLAGVPPAKQPIATTPPPTQPQPAKVTPAAVKTPPVAATPGKGAFAVQLGSFSQEQNAGAVQQKIAALGLPVYKQELTRDGKKMWRVRAGPFTNRDEADRAARTIRDRGAMSGSVVSAAN